MTSTAQVETMEIEHANGDPTGMVIESRFANGVDGTAVHRVREGDWYLTEDMTAREAFQWLKSRDLALVPRSRR